MGPAIGCDSQRSLVDTLTFIEIFSPSLTDYETRCPKGKKTLLYHKAKVEKYAPYLNQDGLSERVTTYSDRSRTFKATCRLTLVCIELLIDLVACSGKQIN